MGLPPGNVTAQSGFGVGRQTGQGIIPDLIQSNKIAPQGMVHARHVVAVGLVRVTNPEEIEVRIGRDLFPGIKGFGVRPCLFHGNAYRTEGDIEEARNVSVAESCLKGLDL